MYSINSKEKFVLNKLILSQNLCKLCFLKLHVFIVQKFVYAAICFNQNFLDFILDNLLRKFLVFVNFIQ